MLTPDTTLTLNNGIALPAFGLGVYRSSPADTAQAVTAALGAGYRLIDTASVYRNEAEVAEGLRAADVAREDIFVTTKLWITEYGYDDALAAFDASQARLGLDVIDMYCLHWPLPVAFDRTLAAWRAAERLLAEGRVRAIGVCNFAPEHLDRLAEHCTVVPAINQVERHPYFNQQALRREHAERGIVTQAWSPIGGAARYRPATPDPARDPLTDTTLATIAAAHDKTPAHIMLRWHLQRGVAVVPKSIRPERIADNIDVFDFALTETELETIDRLETGQRSGAAPDEVDFEYAARRH
ncbi:MAG: oxidoreductase [Xanthomonadales bacterium]|nr:oxidoreductase [Xanthomonadales bacterium]|tara:strand:+ start:45 stop:935 length:891 start_codon:yes stop_codon:yes gene_type:complete